MSQKVNVVNFRFEKAILPSNDFKLDQTAVIHILKQNSEEIMGFYTQNLIHPQFIELEEPSDLLKEFKSKKSDDYKKDEPIWAEHVNGEITDGDLWVPINKETNTSLTVRVSSGNFHGYVDLKLSDQNLILDIKNYDLHEKTGNRINGASIRLSFQYGTHYNIELNIARSKDLAGSGGLDKTDLIHHKSLNLKKNFHYQVHGANASSRFYTCENHSESFISRLKASDVTVKTSFFLLHSIGEPIAVSLRVTMLEINHGFYLKNVEIKTGDYTQNFPCYQWVNKGRMKTISIANGLLPGKNLIGATNANLLQLRKNELEVAKSRYQWQKLEGLPSFLFGTEYGSHDLLPREESFSVTKTKNFVEGIFSGVINKVHTSLKTFFGFDLKHVEDFHKVYRPFGHLNMEEPKDSATRWTEDSYFGWMYVAGTNPNHLTLCNEVPKQYADHKFDDFSGAPINLVESALKGRLFFADYTGLSEFKFHTEGVPSPPALQDGTKYAAPCSCLLHVDSDKKLRPIAIQLLPGGPIFTPKDNKWQWMYAKMVVRNADSQYHQIWDHWFNAHAISEVFSVSINRALSRVHPLYRLLINHLKYTIAINTSARHALINPGGTAQLNTVVGSKMVEFILSNYATMDLNKLDFPSRIEKCGFRKTADGVDKGALDEFPYVDDGSLVWDAISNFVGEYIRLYYHSDDDITTDSELQDWFTELRVNGHPRHGESFPNVKSLDDLQKFISSIIWTAACHHSVVNFNQYKVFGFIPNAPLNLFAPIAPTKEIIDEAYIMKSLPGLGATSSVLATIFSISHYSPDEEYLSTNPYVELIGETAAKECVDRFHQRLNEIENKIDARNEQRVKKGYTEYLLLKPSKIPNSVAV